jgi:hypothetical protein
MTDPLDPQYPDELWRQMQELSGRRKKRGALAKLLGNVKRRRSALDFRKGALPRRLFENPMPGRSALDEIPD